MHGFRREQLEQPYPELVVLQYPGIVKNLDRALSTLGGLPRISQYHFASQPLELRHTPDNPYTSCSLSEKKVDANVNYLYTFETMCDFQYLPIKKRPQGDGYDDLIPRLIPRDIPSALSWFYNVRSDLAFGRYYSVVGTEIMCHQIYNDRRSIQFINILRDWWERPDVQPGYTPLFLPPFQFSRYNTPSNKILCRETDFSLDKTRRKTGHGQNLRVERKALSVTVHANDQFPIAATPEAIADADFRCKNEEPHRLLSTLFEERPMWTRIAITYKTGLDDNLLRFRNI
uniref:PMD domain-containing protein n=1 Tax=Heterorhabditis bacteriophora TaxID=37862 RepID=A0A1I7XE16_HETBA